MLPEVQKRRIKKYYFDDMTLEEIAKSESCTFRAIKFSIDIGLNKLKEISDKSPNNTPNFTKGAITGPFTFSTSFSDTNGKSAYYNETLREVIVKTLSLKALWQIKEFKKASKKVLRLFLWMNPVFHRSEAAHL